MKPDRWKQIERIYYDAIECAPENRSAFLDEACQDDLDLRREVESLISSSQKAEDFILVPAIHYSSNTVRNSEIITGPVIEGVYYSSGEMYGDQESYNSDEYVQSLMGRTLGRYELMELLGAGGMGRVFRARDTVLDRDVAIKLLPRRLAHNEEALRRFEREAKAIAVLSHPNILAIYDFGVDQGITYAVTELLEGETLRDLLKRKQLSWRRAAEIGAFVADATAAAHSKGIIHRDIKPANIFITEDGQTKVLDFGIASARSLPEPTISGSSQATTIPMSTLPGTVLGTIGYMSPEQLRHESVGATSDIFSLGCVLYEMFSGQRPFLRETDVDTIAAVLKEEPPTLERESETPEALRSLVMRCLKKNPQDRYASAEDVACDLRRAIKHHTRFLKPFASSPPDTPWWRRRRTFAALGTFAILATALWWFFAPRSGTDSASSTASKNIEFISLTATGNVPCSAISPDGNYVAYATFEGERRSTLWLVQLATSTRRAIIPASDVNYQSLTFSRDGSYVYYVAYPVGVSSPTLFRVPALGGPGVKVLDNVEGPISFSPHGSEFAFTKMRLEQRDHALFTAATSDPHPQLITSLKNPERFNSVAWSPDGKMIAAGAGLPEGTGNMYVVVVNPKDPNTRIRKISSDRWEWVGQMDWLSDSSGIVMVAQRQPGEVYQVWRLRYADGKATQITSDTSMWPRLGFSSKTGRAVALQRTLATNVWLIPSDNPSRASQVTYGVGGYRGGIAWTPDGRLVCDTAPGPGIPTISIMDADGRNSRQLTGDFFKREALESAEVTRDGRYVIFTSDATGMRHIWRMDLEGINPVQLTRGTGEDFPSSTPDGRWVVFARQEQPEAPETLWKVSIDGGEPVQLTRSIASYPSVSPNGKYIACVQGDVSLDDGGKLAIYSIDGGDPVKVFPQKTYSRTIKWTPDGRAITYIENAVNDTSRIWLQPVDGANPKVFAEFGRERIFGLDWSPDQKYLACVRGLWTSNAVLIKGIN